MKIVKTASGKNKIKMSRSEWTDLGKKAGWMKKISNSNPQAISEEERMKWYNIETAQNPQTDSRTLQAILEKGNEDDVSDAAFNNPNTPKIAKAQVMDFGIAGQIAVDLMAKAKQEGKIPQDYSFEAEAAHYAGV